MEIISKPIGRVINSRKEPIDDNWSEIISEIELMEHIPEESLNGIETFSHIEIVFYFDKIDLSKISFAGHPRGNKDYPYTGIFAQRKKERPNGIGLCIAELIKHNGKRLMVKRLDAIDGTPVIDIKPVFKEFLPSGEIKQPAWTNDLMKNYW
ncbi:MAG TPA: tRNA (N6-threonylcarbamoyladenosine(37)-N6)-methyltransferase TrmO [Candidatus Babeliaceae bacterium]|nr:tRNA (N6-threonylcarbamoyladenosine(37)-N6)-methyltransferase TrmO [Candidatus Babeliaceae bacterium]